MIQALCTVCSASNLLARAAKIKKPLFKQTHKVTFHIITSLGVVFSLSTLISKLSRAKIIGSFKLQVSLWLSAKVTKVGGIRKIMVLWQAVFLAASPVRDGSAVKSHSTILQRLRRLISMKELYIKMLIIPCFRRGLIQWMINRQPTRFTWTFPHHDGTLELSH